MHAYEAELEAQLRGTTLDASFERATPHASCSTAATGSSSRTAAAAASGGGIASAGAGKMEGQDAEALEPVDLDFNLVRNLVRSVESQQGFAGRPVPFFSLSNFCSGFTIRLSLLSQSLAAVRKR